MGRAPARVTAVAFVSACGFSALLPDDPDGGIPEGPCAKVGSACHGPDVLRTCAVEGADPIDMPCTWGCVDATLPAHCGKIVPSGGAVTSMDLDDDSQLLATMLGSATLDTDTGAITGSLGRGSNAMPTMYTVTGGIGFQVRGNVGVFRFRSLTTTGTLSFVGTRAVAFVALDGITIGGLVDARGTCTQATAGPGGFSGGQEGMIGGGSLRGGGSGSGAGDGGGGGGHAALGGSGGRRGGGNAAGGGAETDPLIPVLSGGGGGGGGNGGSTARGGGGGGALQLVAGGAIRIADMGINAGGCGGKRHDCDGSGGGGGGAGGAILIEAIAIEIENAGLAVNGGGGAGCLVDGANATLSVMPTAGGASQSIGGSGAGGTLVTGLAGTDNTNGGAGGGGAAGRIRLNTPSGSATFTSAFVSPALGTTATTQGKPAVE